MTKLPINQILQGDALEILPTLPANSIHMVITSPPYNAEQEYEEKLTQEQYKEFTRKWILECVRVLVTGGRLAINICNTYRKPFRALNHMIGAICESIPSLLMREEFIWFKGFAAAAGMTAWGSWCSPTNPVSRGCHEYVLVYSKEDYHLDCSEFERSEEPKEHFLSNTMSLWEISPETSRKAKSNGDASPDQPSTKHPAPFPELLPYRLVEFYTAPGQIILDPFMGSGTTAVACLIQPQKRKFIGIEKRIDYIAIAKKRIYKVSNASLDDFFGGYKRLSTTEGV